MDAVQAQHHLDRLELQFPHLIFNDDYLKIKRHLVGKYKGPSKSKKQPWKRLA